MNMIKWIWINKYENKCLHTLVTSAWWGILVYPLPMSVWLYVSLKRACMTVLESSVDLARVHDCGHGDAALSLTAFREGGAAIPFTPHQYRDNSCCKGWEWQDLNSDCWCYGHPPTSYLPSRFSYCCPALQQATAQGLGEKCCVDQGQASKHTFGQCSTALLFRGRWWIVGYKKFKIFSGMVADSDSMWVNGNYLYYVSY